jgi:hypothetical protein
MIADASHAAVNGSATTLKVRLGPGDPAPELLSPAAAAGPGSPLGPRSPAGPLIAPRAPSNWFRRERFRTADPQDDNALDSNGWGLILRILMPRRDALERRGDSCSCARSCLTRTCRVSPPMGNATLGRVDGVRSMSDAANYSATETLRDGRTVEIRAQRSHDREGMQAAIARSSAGSLYRRFFAVRREFSQKETDYFLDIDFVNHVALVAVADDAGRPTIVGGGRYVVVQPGQAEVAFAIVDA